MQLKNPKNGFHKKKAKKIKKVKEIDDVFDGNNVDRKASLKNYPCSPETSGPSDGLPSDLSEVFHPFQSIQP